jgi:hypothetical protein
MCAVQAVGGMGAMGGGMGGGAAKPKPQYKIFVPTQASGDAGAAPH